MTRLAVVLFNLGGPDSPAAVRPFLRNLFSDPAIIGAPPPIRWLLARLISARRAPVAREIYAELGGCSPLLANTREQADALEIALAGEGETRVFISMRYWHPMSAATAREVAAFAPDEIVLLPLYPQYSTTTTASSLADWRRAAATAGLSAPTRAVCCYPTLPGLIDEMAGAIRPLLEQAALDRAAEKGPPRLLLSAHGLPKRIVERGDPYADQVEATAAAIVAALESDGVGGTAFTWTVCYQSRVGPLEWIGPETEDEIARAGTDATPVVVAPVAFVSEHSETLVELDKEYAKLARAAGVPVYLRAPTVASGTRFIGGLADLVRTARARPPCLYPEIGLYSEIGLRAGTGERFCPAGRTGCPQAETA
ncbi:MAG: ferrochelatase [Alphaproteobacteria bacterium]